MKEGLVDRFEPGLPTGPVPDRVTWVAAAVGVTHEKATSIFSTLGDGVKVPCMLWR
jgi:hypothetical protein